MSIPSLSLEGKVALVTGAAGERGVGQAIAMTFAEAGADVAICDEIADIYDRNLEARVEELKACGRRAIGIRADVSRRSDVENMVKKIEEELGPVDILVNNAAILGPSSMQAFEHTEEEWDEVMAVNLKSHYLCSMAVGKGMMERKSGNIIHIDSIEGQTPMMASMRGGRPYCVAKAAVQFYTRMQARQLGKYNIRVNSISPGAVETDMGHHNMWYAGVKKKPANLDDPNRKLFGPGISDFIPLRRVGEPSEIASIALFLATEGSSYITGSIIVADGGMAV